MIAPCEDRVKRLPLALKAEQNARVSWQSLYRFLRTDKIHPIIQRLLYKIIVRYDRVFLHDFLTEGKIDHKSCRK